MKTLTKNNVLKHLASYNTTTLACVMFNRSVECANSTNLNQLSEHLYNKSKFKGDDWEMAKNRIDAFLYQMEKSLGLID